MKRAARSSAAWICVLKLRSVAGLVSCRFRAPHSRLAFHFSSATHGQSDVAVGAWEAEFGAVLSREAGKVSGQSERHGAYTYTLQSHPANGRPVFYRTRHTDGRPAVEYFLDLSSHPLPGERQPLGQVQVRTLRPSPDPQQRWVAVVVDTDGSERCQLVLVAGANPPRHDVGTPRRPRFLSSEVIHDVGNMAWAPASTPQRLYYTVLDAALRACEVRVHTVGTDPATDAAVWRDDAADRYVDVAATKDGTAVMLHVNSRTAGRVAVLETAPDEGGPPGFRIGQHGQEQPLWLDPPGRAEATRSYATLAAGRVYAVTSTGDGDELGILSTPLTQALRAGRVRDDDWVPFLMSSPRVLLDDVDVFREGMIVYGKRTADGKPQVMYLPYHDERGQPAVYHPDDLNRPGSLAWAVPLPDDAVEVEGGANAAMDADAFEYVVHSTTAPPQACSVPLRPRGSRTVTVGDGSGQPSTSLARCAGSHGPIHVAAGRGLVSYQLHIASMHPDLDTAPVRVPVTVLHRSDLGIDAADVQAAAFQLPPPHEQPAAPADDVWVTDWRTQAPDLGPPGRALQEATPAWRHAMARTAFALPWLGSLVAGRQWLHNSPTLVRVRRGLQWLLVVDELRCVCGTPSPPPPPLAVLRQLRLSCHSIVPRALGTTAAAWLGDCVGPHTRGQRSGHWLAHVRGAGEQATRAGRCARSGSRPVPQRLDAGGVVGHPHHQCRWHCRWVAGQYTPRPCAGSPHAHALPGCVGWAG